MQTKGLRLAILENPDTWPTKTSRALLPVVRAGPKSDQTTGSTRPTLAPVLKVSGHQARAAIGKARAVRPYLGKAAPARSSSALSPVTSRTQPPLRLKGDDPLNSLPSLEQVSDQRLAVGVFIARLSPTANHPRSCPARDWFQSACDTIGARNAMRQLPPDASQAKIGVHPGGVGNPQTTENARRRWSRRADW
jgi:hypothetical protein